MTLQNIQTALRPQFIWESKNSWKTSKEFEGGRHIGICVFVGVATLNNFSPGEICNWVNISEERYGELWQHYQQQLRVDSSSPAELTLKVQFRKPYRQMTAENTRGTIQRQTIQQMRKRKVYVKSILVQSYLVNFYGARKIKLIDATLMS